MTRFFASSVILLLAFFSTAEAWTTKLNFDSLATGNACGMEASDASVVSSDFAYSGNKSCKMSINKGEQGYGKWGGILPHPQNLKVGDEVWLRVRVLMPNGFDYNSYSAGNRLKFLRLGTKSVSGDNEGYVDLYLNRSDADYPFGFIFEGENEWVFMGDPADRIRHQIWDTYEVYVKFDSVPVSQGGQARARVWKNGKLLADIDDKKTLKSKNSYSDRTLIFTYWNGNAPKTQSLYIDDIVVTSDAPIEQDKFGNKMVGIQHRSILPNPPPVD